MKIFDVKCFTENIILSGFSIAYYKSKKVSNNKYNFNLNVTFKGSIVKWRTIAHSTATLPQLQAVDFCLLAPSFFLDNIFSAGWKLSFKFLEFWFRAVGETKNCLHFWHCYYIKESSVCFVSKRRDKCARGKISNDYRTAGSFHQTGALDQ